MTMMMMIFRPIVLMRSVFLLTLCWSFVHGKYYSTTSLRFSHRFLFQRFHYEEKGQEQQPPVSQPRTNRRCNRRGHTVVLRNCQRGSIGANLLSKQDKRQQQGFYSSLSVADLRGGGSRISTSILASPVTCILAVIGSVGLRVLQSSVVGDDSSVSILVSILQRVVNYYLIGYFFFALVQWQKRVQEAQNSKP